jgi:hypothetical protein
VDQTSRCVRLLDRAVASLVLPRGISRVALDPGLIPSHRPPAQPIASFLDSAPFGSIYQAFGPLPSRPSAWSPSPFGMVPVTLRHCPSSHPVPSAWSPSLRHGPVTLGLDPASLFGWTPNQLGSQPCQLGPHHPTRFGRHSSLCTVTPRAGGRHSAGFDLPARSPYAVAL